MGVSLAYLIVLVTLLCHCSPARAAEEQQQVDLVARAADGTLSIDLSKPLFTFHFKTTTKHPKNWVAIWPYNKGPVNQTRSDPGSLLWQYVVDEEGDVRLNPASPASDDAKADLKAGNAYTAYLLKEDQYEWLAKPINFQWPDEKSSSSSAAPSKTSASATGASSTSAAATSTSAAAKEEPSGGSSNKTALGVGLGVGLAGGLALIGVLIFCLMRHRRKSVHDHGMRTGILADGGDGKGYAHHGAHGSQGSYGSGQHEAKALNTSPVELPLRPMTSQLYGQQHPGPQAYYDPNLAPHHPQYGQNGTYSIQQTPASHYPTSQFNGSAHGSPVEGQRPPTTAQTAGAAPYGTAHEMAAGNVPVELPAKS